MMPTLASLATLFVCLLGILGMGGIGYGIAWSFDANPRLTLLIGAVVIVVGGVWGVWYLSVNGA